MIEFKKCDKIKQKIYLSSYIFRKNNKQLIILIFTE